MRLLDSLGTWSVSALRFGLGSAVGRVGERPTRRLALYDFEACPFCRKVRETLSILDLEVDVYPCPKRGSRFRPGVVERGGREQFPYLIDAGAGVELYESDAIIAYLFANYGAGPAPLSYRLGPLTDVAAVLAGAPRAARGVFARPSQRPERPLELWSFESSPACRLVREKLCELEIPYVLHNAARGSDRRAQPAGGRAEAELPRLFDPNGKWLLMGTRAIQGHLEQRYAREL